MASVNKVILVGNLGRDPETRYSPDGAAITNVTIATSDRWKDKTSGEMKEATEWHRVVFFGRLAEIAGEYLKKGRSVYVEGKLRTRKWTDKDGNDATRPRSLPTTCRCSARGTAQAAATSTMRARRRVPRKAAIPAAGRRQSRRQTSPTWTTTFRSSVDVVAGPNRRNEDGRRSARCCFGRRSGRCARQRWPARRGHRSVGVIKRCAAAGGEQCFDAGAG